MKERSYVVIIRVGLIITLLSQISAQKLNPLGFIHEPSCTNKTLNSTWPQSNSVGISYFQEDDVTMTAMMGAVLQIRDSDRQFTCGRINPMGLIQLEALLWTMKLVNLQQTLERSFKFGVTIKDDCANATLGLRGSMEFVQGALSEGLEASSQYSSTCQKRSSTKHFVVFGGSSSATSLNMAGLFKLFKIPQISHQASDFELDDEHYYPYFSRTIPSDDVTAEVMAALIGSYNWTYVNVIYAKGSAKTHQRLSTLVTKLDAQKVCIAHKLAVESPFDTEIIAQQLHESKITESLARVTILLSSDDSYIENLLEAVRLLNATDRFQWIGSSDWSRSPTISEKYATEIDGCITVEPQTSSLYANPTFAEHLKQVLNNPLEKVKVGSKYRYRNPWLLNYWEETLQCKFREEGATKWSPHTCKYDRRICTGNETLNFNQWMNITDKAQPISDAVLAAVNAVKMLQQQVCPGSKEVCASMINMSGEKLLSLLRDPKNKFRSLAESVFQFTNDGKAPSRFSIYNFQASSDKNKGGNWRKVGQYLPGELEISEPVVFAHNQLKIPSSLCSLPCAQNQAKQEVHNSPCCWTCINCSMYEYKHSDYECRSCPQGELPSITKDGCNAIPIFYVNPSEPIAIIAISVACTGILLTCITAVVYLVKYDTPVVRASGRELTFVLLAGIMICYLTTFVLVAKPSLVICILQNTAPGLGFTICYAAILLKANRIYRIFEGSKKTRRTPKLVSPQSMVLLCAAIVIVQIFISITWTFLRPPEPGFWYPTREDNFLVCLSQSNGQIERSHMIGLSYPIVLLLACTAHAVLTRKIPGAFNESKLIGLTVYTTCVIWLAFVPIYYTTSTNLTVMMGSMCFTISLSATVSLICIFFPKLYIIVIRPEKNVRCKTKKVQLPCSAGNKSSSNATTSSGSPDVQRSLLPKTTEEMKEVTTTNEDSTVCE